MPSGPRRPCRSYACAALVTSGYCPEHQPLQSQVDAKYRGSAQARGYDSRWRKLRDWVIAREPVCRLCAQAGRVRPADLVDHIRPLAAGGTHHPTNLQPLCRRCHAAKTADDQRR